MQEQLAPDIHSSPPPAAGTPLVPSILQVVSNVPGGVLDAVHVLAGELAALGTENDVLEIDPERRDLLARDVEGHILGLRRRLEDAVVLFHYSGYGLARRGLCFWFVTQVEALRSRHEALRIAIIFHELYAGGPPWRSAFWVSPLQRGLAARLLGQADLAIATTEKHERWLRVRSSRNQDFQRWPIFSNIGEPRADVAFERRRPTLVLFGTEPTRARAVAAPARLRDLVSRLGVGEVVEVGSGGRCWPEGMPSAYRFLGRVEDQIASAQLLEARFALIDYPSDYLAKSGVYAAYAAHGCVVINVNRTRNPADDLVCGTHYLAPAFASGTDFEKIGKAARAWYQQHTRQVQARALLDWARAPG